MPSIIAVRSAGAISSAAATSAADGPGLGACGSTRAKAVSTMPRQGASAGASASNAREPFRSLLALALLLRRQRQEEARAGRLRSSACAASKAARASAVTMPPSAARIASPEPALPRRRRPEQADGVAVCRDGVLAAAEPQVDRRDHLPAAGRPPAHFARCASTLAISISMSFGDGGAERRAASGWPGRLGDPRPR